MDSHTTDSDPCFRQRPNDPGRGRGARAGSRKRGRHRGHRARKEKILHTRVSEQLSEDIRAFADELRVPASNLVRNVLEEVFTIVDSVSDDMGHLMDDVIEEAEGVRERIRRQARARRSRTRGGRRERRRASGRIDPDAEDDFESEFRRDERAEAADAARSSVRTQARDAGDPTDEAAAAKPSTAELFPEILGWQPLILNRAAECGRCGSAIASGESGFLGVGAAGLTTTTLCGPCAGGRG